ncbi:MAG: conjugative transposon protein TraN [Bacteroidota bacterium]
MRRILFLVFAVCLFQGLNSQEVITITTDKTTSIVFAVPILHIDRGTKDILVQQIKEVDNILLLKAACAGFHPTNLSVLTTDGTVHSFIISYDTAPASLIYKIPATGQVPPSEYARQILDNEPFLHHVKCKSWKMRTALTGIYIRDSLFYFQIQLTNESPIDYDIDFLRFYIRDKNKARRTASQENELQPICTAGAVSQVKAYSSIILSVALDKFTIPDAKYMAIEMGEKNGGRFLRMKIKNRHLLKSRMPD